MVCYTRTKWKALAIARDQARMWWGDRRRVVALTHHLVPAAA
jgi:hypothetical protein